MDPIRNKGTQLLQQVLGTNEGVAEAIEQEIYETHQNKVDENYKESLRTHLFNLKENGLLRQRVISGDITPQTFAQMSTDDMAKPDLRLAEEHLRRRSITDCIFHDHIQPRHRNQDNPDEDRP
ncbi:transcription factor S-II, central domain-containing protein [Phascolomyces articulosus]|uniref:Transcription factor S-II, central domain-containing protein n=1 Tax=Phascolomyces articulosus TaxID=60185 RepID=A0AAD5JNU6_9FUNG|nr:transcription factor S-II, central domain-containing protein [Phascolomyces articulosus]